MTNNHKQDNFDQSISEQYRNESSEQVPPSLDDAILNMAKNALQQSQSEDSTITNAPDKKSWLQWYATAAVLVLGIGVVTFMQNEIPQQIQFEPALPQSASEQKPEEEIATADAIDESISTDTASADTASPAPVLSSTEALTLELETQEQMAKARSHKLMETETRQKIERREMAAKKAESAPASAAGLNVTALTDMSSQQKVLKHAIEIEYTEQKTVHTGQTHTHEFMITNKSHQAAAFKIHMTSNQNWTDLGKIPDSVFLSPEQTYLLKVTTQVSQNASVGESEILILEIIDPQDEKVITEIKTEMTVR